MFGGSGRADRGPAFFDLGKNKPWRATVARVTQSGAAIILAAKKPQLIGWALELFAGALWARLFSWPRL